MIHRHRAYGLEIDSYIALPELQRGDIALAADVVISGGEEPPPDPERYDLDLGIEVTRFDNEVLSMTVVSGRKISVLAAAPHSAAVRQYVLGPGLAMILLQRGMTLLHASAVVIGGKAVAFSAESGGGKSTLAAALNARGHALLTDDVCVVDGGLVIPAFPLLKIAERSLHFVTAPGQQLDVETEGDRRLRFHAPRMAKAPASLAAVLLIEKGEAVETIELRGAEAVMGYVRALYWHEVAAGDIRSLLFQQAAALAASIPIRRLVRPFDLETLEQVCQSIETSLE